MGEKRVESGRRKEGRRQRSELRMKVAVLWSPQALFIPSGSTFTVKNPVLSHPQPSVTVHHPQDTPFRCLTADKLQVPLFSSPRELHYIDHAVPVSMHLRIGDQLRKVSARGVSARHTLYGWIGDGYRKESQGDILAVGSPGRLDAESAEDS